MRHTAGAVGVLSGLLLATSPAPVVVLTLQDPRMVESSGLVASRRHPGVLWTHADGGSVAQVVAVGAGGRSVATVTLAGVDPYDPEALAPGRDREGRPVLFLGDIGDNRVQRQDVSVFRFAEPARLVDATVTARWYRFTYPDGPHDAEALLVDADGRIMVATKALSGAGLYLAPRDLLTEDEGTNELTRVADVPSLVTDGAVLPDGRFALRTYAAVHVFDRPGHETARADLPLQPQGESLAAAGDRLLVGSEGLHSQVLAVPVPGAATDPPAPSTAPTTAPSGSRPDVTDEARSRDGGLLRTRISPVVAIVVLLGGLAVVLRRRHRRHG